MNLLVYPMVPMRLINPSKGTLGDFVNGVLLNWGVFGEVGNTRLALRESEFSLLIYNSKTKPPGDPSTV